MRTVYICGYYNFPRGSASANYVQYLAKAILESGDAVTLITNINETEDAYTRAAFEKYKDSFSILPIEMHSSKLIHHIEYNYLIGKKITNRLIEGKASQNDIIITYSSNLLINNSIISFAQKNNIKCGACIVEWYSDEYFGKNLKELRKYKKLFYEVFDKLDFVLPISSSIERHFSERRISTMRLPILCDTREYKLTQKDSSKRAFIYTANGKMKDALRGMVTAFASINNSENVEFHITGVNRKEILGFLSNEEIMKIDKILKLHSWMKYYDLIDLYNNATFIILAREVNQMTLSNFPSKITEAMSHGVIPVVSRVGDYTELLVEDNVNGIIFDGANTEVIVEAVNRSINLSNDEVARLSKRAFEDVEKKHDYRAWIKPVHEFFEKIQNN